MKRIVVLGGGESGVGAAVLAHKQGFDVFVSDASKIKETYKLVLNKHAIRWEEGTHTYEEILQATEVVKSPGIPDKVAVIQEIKKQNIPIISEIEFAGRYTSAKTICITGSNGKTTTTMLIYHILKQAGLNVGLAGNVGKSFALQVAEETYEYYVIELSSFQLDNMYTFRADVAILLNITPDHLDRYEYDFQKYVEAKMRITQNQTANDVFIYWEDDKAIQQELTKHKINAKLYPFSMKKNSKNNAYVENNNLTINTEETELTMNIEKLAIKGTHNVYNSMAAALSASVMNIKKEQIRNSLADFEGVEHRLEPVAKVRNIMFINDSKATNVNSCWYALESMHTPVVLILGGTDKGNDYNEILQLINKKVHTLVFLGTDNSKLEHFFGETGIKTMSTNSMEEAVKVAYQSANKGDTVLLSPCCASFDLFANYEDRGAQFKHCVKNL
ncbi:MAG: UDP-N-acetylmuramoyl-L-alanine--D-glutamate ligase [Paludibacteraceae bacterium]|nr:UDP-N-acetylmuramoyl-L-alanine--D-glutamate ligase [Paludibacteraceae bacterium]MBP6284351.1 UDP-N-acetylmuramoyl-L-alanine--D-glutamate ligase [Paludibacteraceae bacterium]